MAGPGDILGGLAQIGAIGAHGAYGGDIEGRVLKQNMQAQETENQLRMLRLLQQQAAGMAPIGFGPGTLILDPQTGRTMQVPFAPKQPVSLGPGHTLVDPQTGKPMFSTPQAPPHPMSVSPGASLVDPSTGKPMYTAPATPPRPMSIGPGHSLVDPSTGKSLYTLAPTPQRPISLGPGHNLVDPATGKTLAQGPAPVGSGPGGTKETVETTERIGMRKPIPGDSANFKALQQALPDVVRELSLKAGFNVPGRYWLGPDGQPVMHEGRPIRKEEVIARAIRQRFGAEVEVRWVPEPSWTNKDAGRFAIVHAWEPTQREKIEKRRTVGPPSSVPRAEPADEEE